MAKNRCINIDWLSVYCLETVGQRKDADYFIKEGWKVEQRPYGTPQYREMFTLYTDRDKPFLEIRRNPYSLRGDGGFFEPESCHIRLSNYMCYHPNPIGVLRDFMLKYGYSYVSIQRIDLCLDFHRFDSGKTPQKFLQRFMKNELSKINQCNVSAHGRDKWEARDWNSLSWGSPNSPIRTRFYNKSLEMKEKGVKYHILDAWQDAGLDVEKDVYRVEFAIKSEIKGYVNLDKKHKIPNNLTTYDSREKCLFIWHVLANIYFHFKEVRYNDKGELVRKDRCPDYVLFRTDREEGAYKPDKLTTKKEATRGQLTMVRELTKVWLDDFEYNEQERMAAFTLLRNIYTNTRCNVIQEICPQVNYADPPF